MRGTRETYRPVRNAHRQLSTEQLYRDLSPRAKSDLQNRLETQALHERQRQARRKSQLTQSLIEGVCLYLPVELLLYGFSILSFTMAIAVGLVLGWTWNRIRPNPSFAGLSAVLGFVAIRAVCGMGFLFHAILAMVFIICASFAIRITRASESMGV